MAQQREIVETEEPIAIADLERCLRRPWDHAQERPLDDRPTCRALTMNVIAVAPLADESLLASTFRDLVATHPCLAFLLLLTDDDSDLDVRLASTSSETAQGRTLLLEQVTMRISRRERPRVPSLLRPVLVHDLPTLTFWSGPLPRRSDFAHEIARLGDSVVYDSALFTDPAADVERVSGYGLTATDMAFVRLQPWRQALAEAFESVPWPPVTRVRASVQHSGTCGTRAAVAQLGRWLRERLRAELREEVREGHGPCFEPTRVELAFDDVRIEVRHGWPQPSLQVAVTLEDRCLLPFTKASPAVTRGQLLAEIARGVERSAPDRG
ncbi:MAG: glucose-6-phosphate dehydrogenase assembly protein OpcA [Planctomycetes bacterium]|nr:glucose-6-phosphate dehydrogenase assembly protein OpcA [Planctomycetota bacterium]